MIPDLIRPAAENVVRVWPIGTTVGKVKNGGAKLLEPATPAEPMLCLLVRSRRSATTSLMAAALACSAQNLVATMP